MARPDLLLLVLWPVCKLLSQRRTLANKLGKFATQAATAFSGTWQELFVQESFRKLYRWAQPSS